MSQTTVLGWAVGYNAVALPIAAGVFAPAWGLVLRPEMAALAMSGSSVIVPVNALMLKRLRLPDAPAYSEKPSSNLHETTGFPPQPAGQARHFAHFDPHKEPIVVRSTARIAVPVVTGLLALTLSACGSADHSTSETSHGTSTAPTAAATASSGDVEFAQMMIPHHEQAVEMADLALSNGSASSEVKSLATQIKGAQDPEIQKMKVWLRQWGASESSGPMGHGSGGMQDDQDMSTLKAATGPEFDRMWLTMMIDHHQGAVTMAQDVLQTSSNAEVTQLAKAVVEGQTKEIGTMQAMVD